MKKVMTKDGSETFYSKEYTETYHSTSGALQEGFEKFVGPSGLFEGCKILDICFGIGYNSLAAIHTAIEDNLKISITAIENDPKIVRRIKDVVMDEKYRKAHGIIKKVVEDKEYKDDLISIKLIIDDARKTVKKLNNKFDFVFFDPFSPKKHPELWTEEFFKDIYKIMNKGVLTTYSCARVVRDNLRSAGFNVEDGPSIGRRGPSTIAKK
ncbi:tRNA (5-methylaminomethyl-2-thiouridine)(34)-methyltransferase MnmD [Nanoarchaeota archaeon]